jgi:hypothetical protein
MRPNHTFAPASDGDAAVRRKSGVGMRTRQLECVRAFQTDRSWYQAYWYPELSPRRQGFVARILAKVFVLFESWATSRPAKQLAAEPEEIRQ